jgi:hypothetical protein
MIRYLKYSLFYLSFFLIYPSSYGQERMNLNNSITEKFLNYCAALPREEVFVRTDREDYIAGEDLWFTAYLIDRQSGKPSYNSKILYFELLNQENRPVVQKRILMEMGVGPGQIVLPDTLGSGSYTVRAYTSWMKNFLPENCFMKDIRIHNSFKNKAYLGKSYPVPVRNNNGSPGVLSDEGLTLNVNNLKPDTLEIIVNTSENYRTVNNNVFYIFIQTHGLIEGSGAEKAIRQVTKIFIPKNELLPGINQITVFNSRGIPVCERFVYTPDRTGDHIILNSPDRVKTRNKISLGIQMDKELAGKSDSTNLSVTVTPASVENDDIELADYMIFASEFGVEPYTFLKGRKLRNISPSGLDSMLVNAKSNWINWRSILSGKLPQLKYKQETGEHYLQGRLIDRNSQTADTGKYVLMSVPGKVAVFQYAKTDKEAGFSFNIGINDLIKDMVIQPAEPGPGKSIRIESSFSDRYLKSVTYIDSLNKETPSYISKQSINYQVNKIYGSSYLGATVNKTIAPIKPKRFYGKPDVGLIMADYIKLPVMEEVFFELIQGAFLKNKKTGYEITIADQVENKVFGAPPCLMIDGVIISNPSLIANLDPETVEQIDVVKTRYFVGDYMFYGLINVITKSGDYSIVPLSDYATRLQYRVIDPVWSFKSPDYSDAELMNSHVPDFRNTLYWNPAVVPDKDGKAGIEFWSSDVKSDYIINIQGITSDGKVISSKKLIKVE